MIELSAIEATAKEADLDVFHIDRGFDCTAIVREQMAQGRNLFIAAGGDGTISNVIQPLVNTEALLGVLPLGTFNHFARDLGIPLDWRAAFHVALAGTTRQVDTARVNERFFINNVSIGLYPELISKREERGRHAPRWKARIYAAIATLRKYPYVTLAIESGPKISENDIANWRLHLIGLDETRFPGGAAELTLANGENSHMPSSPDQNVCVSRPSTPPSVGPETSNPGVPR